MKSFSCPKISSDETIFIVIFFIYSSNLQYPCSFFFFLQIQIVGWIWLSSFSQVFRRSRYVWIIKVSFGKNKQDIHFHHSSYCVACGKRCTNETYCIFVFWLLLVSHCFFTFLHLTCTYRLQYGSISLLYIRYIANLG